MASLHHDVDGSRQDPASESRPVALVTGAGRTVAIGAGLARQLAPSGRDIAFSCWSPYDDRMSWGVEADAADTICHALAEHGAAVAAIEADLSGTAAPAAIFDEAERRLGSVTALVMWTGDAVTNRWSDWRCGCGARRGGARARRPTGRGEGSER